MIYQILDSYNYDIILKRNLLVAPDLERRRKPKCKGTPITDCLASFAKMTNLFLLNWEPNAAFVVWAVFAN